MKRTMAIAAVIATATMGISSPALADGMKDPYKARADCDKRGEGKSVEALKKCCSNLILVEKISEQRKLEEQCVKGKGAKQEPTKKK